jgi:hypothetical protein
MYSILSRSLILLLLTIVFTIGCLTTVEPMEEIRVSLFFDVDNIGVNIEDETNSLFVKEFKFAISRFNLAAEDDLVIEGGANVNTFIFAFTELMNEARLIFDAPLGFSEIEFFTGFTMFLEPVAGTAGILDNDFFGEEENFSTVIKGTINEIEFEFTSSAIFEKEFEFAPVSLTGTNMTLVILKSINLNELFLDDDGRVIDPTDSQNYDLIMERIENQITVSASSGSVFF